MVKNFPGFYDNQLSKSCPQKNHLTLCVIHMDVRNRERTEPTYSTSETYVKGQSGQRARWFVNTYISSSHTQVSHQCQ